MRVVRRSGMVGVAPAVTVAVAAPPAGGAPSLPRSTVGGTAQTPGCVPVVAAECGSVRVPLFRSRPSGPMIDIGYALIRHRDPALPAARGTVVINPGGPGGDVISGAAQSVEQLAGLLWPTMTCCSSTRAARAALTRSPAG